MFEIEKNIQEPTKKQALKGITSFLKSMKEGESFVCDKSMRSGVLTSAKQAGIWVTTKKIDDEMIRVWVIKEFQKDC